MSVIALVGGVPGAGKSTAMAQVAAGSPEVVALDPEEVRGWIQRRLSVDLRYGAYRPLVHTVHAVRVLAAVLDGPVAGRTLLVHDPATRPGRRRLFAGLARWRGWEPVLVYVDVSRATAEDGQLRRGRVVDPDSFAAHWRRWEELRTDLVVAPREVDDALWSDVVLTDRAGVAAELRRLVRTASVATSR